MRLWEAVDTDDTPNVIGVSAGFIRPDGSDEVSFKVPGGLEGVLRIDAKWGSVNEDSKITITGGELSASKTEALPNETITITGNGFGSQTCIPAANITLDSVPVLVDEEIHLHLRRLQRLVRRGSFQLRPVRGHHRPVAG